MRDKTTKTQRAQRKIKNLCVLCVFVVLIPGHAKTGDDLFAQGRYQEAAGHYQDELRREPDSSRLHTNLACALYRLGRYDEAMRELSMARDLETEPAKAARIHYNIGNCYYSTDRLDDAIESYKTALRLNPNDRLAKYNLEVALKRKEQSPPPRASSSQSPNNSGSSDTQKNPDPTSNNSRDERQKQQAQMTRDEAERILDALKQTEKGPTHKGNTQRSYFNTTIKRDW
jgi:Ca-activated chloride channel homolog